MDKQADIQEMTLRDIDGNVTGYRQEELFGDLSVDFTEPYTISHFPSGRSVIQAHEIFNRQDVIKVAIELAPLFDGMPGDKSSPSKDDEIYMAWAMEMLPKVREFARQLWDDSYEEKD